MDIVTILTITGSVLGIAGIFWLSKLESTSQQTVKDLSNHEKDTDARFNVVNGAFTLVQGDVRELQLTSINRDDLKEVKNELTSSIEKVGDRTDAAVERLIAVFKKAPASRTPRQPRD